MRPTSSGGALGADGRRLVVDLVGTTFVDSTALGIIAAAARGARRAPSSQPTRGSCESSS